MRLGAAGKVGAALALALGSVTGGAIAAAPAQAFTCGYSTNYFLDGPSHVEGVDSYICDYHATAAYVGIFRNGVLVASGDGFVTYDCNGSAANEYQFEFAESSAGPFLVDCG